MNKTIRHLPRKRFGQHFLVDKGLIRHIIECANLAPSDFVLEIGPGRVLAGLMRRTDRRTRVESLNSLEALEKFVETLRSAPAI